MNKKADVSVLLMDATEEMYRLLFSVDNENFDIDKANLKLKCNGQMVAAAKVYLQSEMIKLAVSKQSSKSSDEVQKLLD